MVKDFYFPMFSNSKQYKRGVGYFTSGWLKENAQGLAQFVENGGTVQFITSPILDKNDLEALQGKYNQEIINKSILNNVEEIEKNLGEETRNLLGWLVYDGILKFKFAIPRNHLEGGEFHDKFGIFLDENNDFVAFNGSMNDSMKGFRNYESISVFKSWGDETSNFNAEDLLQRFDQLWQEKDDNLHIYSMDDIVKNNFIKLKAYSERPYDTKAIGNRIQETKASYRKKPKLPPWLELRDYQKEAYTAWKENNFHGILSMATGTGKTITAFNALVNLLNEEEYLATVVVVPYQHLVTQWAEEAREFGIEFIMCFESSKKWSSPLLNAITKYTYKEQRNIFIITTTSTYISPKFQDPILKLKNLCLIVDEVHNFGASSIQKFYLQNANFRLGLSATPSRYMDEEGTNAILKYMGEIIYSFSLAKAIEMKMLTPYKYYPVLVHLTEMEQDEYIDLTRKISKLSVYNNDNNDEVLKILMMKRAKIISAAENKLPALKKTLIDNKLGHSSFNLFYCAAKTTGDEDNAMRMVDDVHNLLESLGMDVENFTAMDSPSQEERTNLIKYIKKEIINGLVAIRCLDEGVDIPDVKRAFILSSSSNPKEFVQRRGRVLRKADNKEFAEIYDFLVVPYGYKNDEEYKANRKYLEKEFVRYREFAALALNYPDCEKPLIDLMSEYHLLHI